MCKRQKRRKKQKLGLMRREPRTFKTNFHMVSFASMCR